MTGNGFIPGAPGSTASAAGQAPIAVLGGSKEYWDWIHALEDEVEKRGGGLKADVVWSYRDFDFAVVRLVIWRTTKGSVEMIADMDIGHACGPERVVVFRPRDEVVREIEEALGNEPQARPDTRDHHGNLPGQGGGPLYRPGGQDQLGSIHGRRMAQIALPGRLRIRHLPLRPGAGGRCGCGGRGAPTWRRGSPTWRRRSRN